MKQFTSEYFDDKQYTRKGIAKYEAIFGRNFISTGGQRSAKEFLKRLGLKPGMRILDIGCGIGGHAFQMVADYEVRVIGIDISRNMIAIARERCKEAAMESQVRLIHGDIFETQFDATFDVIHSRDAFLHLHEKHRLFSLIHRLLRPAGLLAFADYCRGDGQASVEFEDYVKQRGYCLHTIDDYRRLIESAGLVDVQAEDRTTQFLGILQRELAALAQAQLSAGDAAELARGWTEKIDRVRNGEQRWGWFAAKRSG